MAATLQTYAREFSWRVQQREWIEKPRDAEVLDLERATRREILQALLAEAAEAWKAREALSDVPLSEVYRYLIPNDYPSEVRGTLRDAVSYRIAAVLADSAFWSVEEAQDLPRADLPRLIEGTVDAQPDDAAVHPLVRMAAVLGDLEAWHAAEGERAGALEARRERLRLLWSHLKEDEDRQLLRREAREFGLEVPEDMVRRGWSYLGQWVQAGKKDLFKECGCWPLVTLNYAASASPADWTQGALSDEDRRQMLKISGAHSFEMTPSLKAMLALTMHRMRQSDGGRKLLTSLLSSATTTPDEGTFWTRGEHGWVWYEDSVETHAFVLRAVQELLPEDPRRHGLVQWLFAVAYYLEKEGQLGTREEATVRIGERRQDFVFEPDRYTGKENRIVVPGDEVKPDDATIVVEKETPGFLFAAATWHFSTEKLPEQGDGQLFRVERRYFRRVKTDRETVLRLLENGEILRPGDEVEVHLLIRSRVAAEYVHLRDPRPAGLEPDGARSGWCWGDGSAWYEETRDSGMNFFFESLPAGEDTLKHRVRANMAGTFRTGPATIQSMYAPEHTAYSAGKEIRVE